MFKIEDLTAITKHGNPRADQHNLTMEVVTPLFLAGAKNKAINDRDAAGKPTDIDHEYFRPSSVKSLLRWWWRAVAPHSDSTELLDGEGRIFGDTRHGQGLQVTTQHNVGWKSGIDSMPSSNSLGYLLGQGLSHFRDGVVRPAVYPGSSATVNISGTLSPDVLKSIECMRLLGGLGSRSRRGWGSICSTGDVETPKNLNDYRERLQQLLKSTPQAKRVWSHLTPSTRFVVIDKTFTSWHESLDALGKPMAEMRQKLGGRQNPYGPDHDLVSDLVHKNILPKTAPRRSAFGLPHAYFFKSSKKSLIFSWNGSERRASPLLLHVTKFVDGGFGAVALVMSGPFIPEHSTITADKYPRLQIPPPSMALLDEYLDRLSEKV